MSQTTANQHVMKRGQGFMPLVLVLPFALGAALYLSVVFALFAAIPLAYVSLKQGRFLGVVAGITNTAIVWAVTGQVNAALFFVLAVVLSATMAETIKLKFSPQLTVLNSVVGMMLAICVLMGTYSVKYKVNPFEKVESVISETIDKIVVDVEKYKAANQSTPQDLEKVLMDPQTTKRNVFNELFSSIVIFLLLIALGNYLLLTRLNPVGFRAALGLRKDFFKQWRAPEHLIWPTLATGFCLVVEIPYLSMVAINLFKILMVVYAIQGLAILSALFDSWSIGSGLRPIGYILALAVLLPLVISLGFFDLWFNFREKLKKTKT